jgi:hypothetical protein
MIDSCNEVPKDCCMLQENREFQKQTISQELNILSILDSVVEYQMNWFHHMERMDEGRFYKRLPVFTKR